VLNNDQVDIVYVGNVHAFRKSVGEKVLKANKHCLLEKPFACNTEDAKYLISLARERNLFLMEVSIIHSAFRACRMLSTDFINQYI